MIEHFLSSLWERIAETSYWIAVILSCSCMVLYAASEAKVFKQICLALLASYALLKGITEVLQ